MSFKVVGLRPLCSVSVEAEIPKPSCLTGLLSGVPCSSFSVYTKEVCIKLKI